MVWCWSMTYALPVPTVFYREGNQTFHRSGDCAQLVKRPARGEPHPVRTGDLAELFGVRPCKTCYPDAPRFKMVRRYCPKCNVKRTLACAHNGGMPVTITYKTNYVGLTRDPGEIVQKDIYVWPDRLFLYETGRHDHSGDVAV